MIKAGCPLFKSLTVLFLIFISLESYSQEFSFPSLKGFKIERNYPVYTPDDLWDYINGAAESYNSFEFNELYIAEYKKGNKNLIKVEVYSFLNHEMAFGIYAMERASSYNFYSIGAEGYSDDDLVHFFKGNYYVKVITNSGSARTRAAVKQLASLVAQELEGSVDYPAALSLFPGQGRLAHEEMFISESVLGHEFLKGGFRANYVTEENRFTIYLFIPETEQANRDMLTTYLKKQGLEPGDSADGKFFFRDGYNGDVFMAWVKNYTILITGLGEKDAPLANDYISQILEKTR